MAYKIIDARIGLPPIVSITSVASIGLINSTGVSVGTIVRAEDPSLGMGEFIYLPGVANTIVGALVKYDMNANTTTLLTNTSFAVNPIAVAMSANNTTTSLGWYQIDGAAVIKKTATKYAPATAVWISATAGRIFATTTSGVQIMAAKSINTATIASATSTVTVLINRPHVQGQKI